MKRLVISIFCLVMTGLVACSSERVKTNQTDNIEAQQYAGYLFAYFVGNDPGEEQVYFALSADGFNYRALNQGKPVLNSTDISSTGGVRDPHILRGQDGYFYMVLTDLYVPKMQWNNTAMVMLKSKDLINWSHSIIDIPNRFPTQFGDVNRVWAPQTIYDKAAEKNMLYFSMKQADGPDIIYYAYANPSFTDLESTPKQLYFPPTQSNSKASIDGDIIEKDGKFYLYHKAEDGTPGIKLAISDELTQGYKLVSTDRVDREVNSVEGSATFKLIDSDEYILMYDVYKKGEYQFAKSNDLLNFEIIDQDITMNFHPRHGSVIPVTQSEIDALVQKWGSFNGAVASSASEQVKKMNLVIDDQKQTIYLPVKSGTDLTAFDPKFILTPGASISPTGKQDFSAGDVDYQVTVNQQTKTYKVSARVNNNPVIAGYYADPEIIYSQRDKKYYLYPTSDGFTDWSGTHFETFSSTDLINWKNEGVILDLKKQVTWADRNAWAPAAIEHKTSDKYQYFYYFTAAQKIGVAVADNPQGPFIDSGKALIDFKPDGITDGQEIDPDVFKDPVSGKSYLYWGNIYMAVAELNKDMTSIDKSSLRVLTPNTTFREGVEVFYRNGLYYFLWSENDTRHPDYRVRYATSKSPTGPLNISENNLVIAKDIEKQIFATGHNSVINKPGTDEWYIVYHRFNRPHGKNMGRAAGFHREVCIDKLVFNPDGSIKQTIPTLEGINPQ
ncbi:family 43 glycosylhydrolase [Catenovulum sp. 2E275]|uniref:family 43 glycosylhydrolase n=1 Tax=Catenovulum sp. 2E275 TaxID=2980497 RepID=UPI0021CEC273|nr:family 43 glycosylhydrolase [Catenovulum sp. 2E275]MCU4675267.1 family 43 glycosylhydrolase [Catenovulum sp. 2E275]